MTYFLVWPLFPSAGAWCCLPHAPIFRGPRQVPAVKMQRARSALQTMLLRCSVPSWMRLEKSFLGLIKYFGEPAAPLPPGGLREERGRPARSVRAASVSGGARRSGGGAESQLCALRRQAHFCSIPAAGAQGPACAVAKPLPPGPPARTGPPPGLLSPGTPVPGVPAQSGLCWTVGARLE